MSERIGFHVQDTGARLEIPSTMKPEEHVNLISTIYRRGNDEILPLPPIFIVDKRPPHSPIDELRKYVGNHDRIRPFEPGSGRLPPVLRTYDPTHESYWKAIQDTIDRWKDSSLSSIMKAALTEGLAPRGYHYKINPNTGKVELRKERLTAEYRPDEDGYNDGRTQYGLDPRTGAIGPLRKVCTAEWIEERDGWQRSGHYYGLNPRTGQIELRPNVRTLELHSR